MATTAATTTSGGHTGNSCLGEAAGRPSRYESQKRQDWQTFVRYLGAHHPPLVLRRCSGAHVLEFLRYLDRFGKTRVHAPPCPAYGGRETATATATGCQCPLRQAWGSLDALVGRLRAAFDERHSRGAAVEQDQLLRDAAAGANNPFAARAVRLYLRDVRDAQATARGITYHKKKKKKKKKRKGTSKAAASSSSSSSKNGGANTDGERARAGGHKTTPPPPTSNAAQVQQAPPLPPLPPCLAGVPFEFCEFGTIVGGANGAGCYDGGFYLPLLFNTST